MKAFRLLSFIFAFGLLLSGCQTSITERPMIEPEGTLSEFEEWMPPSATVYITRTPFQPSFATETPAQTFTQNTHEPVPVAATENPTCTATAEPVGEIFPTSTPFETVNPQKFRNSQATAFPNLSAQQVGKVINYLVIGSDTKSKNYFRTDTMVIASIRPDDATVSLISVPRDLYVYIPTIGMNKINTAYLYGELRHYPGGGPALLRDTYLYNLGVRIDKIAIVDFSGFRKIIDTLGGIDLPLACPYTDWRVINPNRSLQSPSNWQLYTVGPGVVHMDGELALWYARSRMRSSDYDRGRRQQEVLRGIYAKALKTNMITRLPELYTEFRKTVKTDAELGDLLDLAPLVGNIGAAKIRSYYITSAMVKSTFSPEGMFVLIPKGDKILAMLQKALAPPDENDKERLKAIVEVCNASGKQGWDQLAAERLHYAGFKTVECRLSDLGRQVKSSIVDLHGNQDSMSITLLTALAFPTSRLTQSIETENPAAFRLIVASDYSPCFSPNQLKH